jgi:hypothetical protein
MDNPLALAVERLTLLPHAFLLDAADPLARYFVGALGSGLVGWSLAWLCARSR